jgi:peptide/nickel transport system permease protein
MFRILRDLLRYNAEFRIGAVLVGCVLLLSLLAAFSPYPPENIYAVPPDLPPSWTYWFGTTSRGQDVFWQLTFAIRNTLLFGGTVALISRLLALVIGLVSGYKGGWIDRVLMSVNDTFIVMPLLPILVLFYFVMRDSMSRLVLALIMASLGWAYVARLIRAVAMSLKSRAYTQSSVFSGMTTREILVQEHLPYVMPIVFSTTMHNMDWTIGLEVTMAVHGFTDINTPTIGGMIYWANQHTAIVAGVWWWIAFPIAVVIMAFVGLFLLAVSMNEYIDPRSRLSRMGGGAR